MGQALYRKYRSKSLSEIVGQEHITKTLENALKTGKLSHAYLFTGPRGVGKTSIARILAHEINNLPYTDESMHLDIIEIDAASNRRIDEIRDLREKVHIAPTSAKYKVYIIDEVHMLTKEAFNALLKTLEEPPAHVVFILATTELHKLPETIVSRTQRFTFKPIDEKQAVKHLGEIAKAEGIDIDKEALALLAQLGRGSFRDSISMLDQVGHSSAKITRTDAEQLVGIAATEHINELVDKIINGQPADIVAIVSRLVADGISPSQTAKQLAAEIRTLIVAGKANQALLTLLSDLLDVSGSPEPAGALEVALFRAQIELSGTAKTASQPAAAPQTVSAPVTKPAPVEPKDSPEPEKPVATAASTDSEPEQSAPKTVSDEINNWWQEVLGHIKSVNNTLYGVLRMAEPQLDENIINLDFGFVFHKKKVDDPATQAKIHEAIHKVTGQNYQINTRHSKQKAKPAAQITTANEPTDSGAQDISAITNIFGGGEVLES